MIDDLLLKLERINKLPLTADERADLMRAAMDEARGGKKPGRKPGSESAPVAQRVREVLADGAWRQAGQVREAIGALGAAPRPGTVNTALRDMVAVGILERKEDGLWATGKAMVWYRLPADEAAE